MHGVLVARVRPYGHLVFLPIIGGTISPFLGRIELPTLYPIMLPKSPVPADWSIFDVTIKTVMQTRAAKTKKAFGGLVMFTTAQCPQQLFALVLSLP
jgi:hypothetical protein